MIIFNSGAHEAIDQKQTGIFRKFSLIDVVT